ncbi:MAG: ParA family protein [Gammaproteobacteria bacterium]|jgi:chromosome partitioning protein
MRKILVLNAKGGSGKSTVATNLAAHYAQQGEHVVLADFDPQRSSLDWLAARPPHYAPVHGLAAADGDMPRAVPGASYMIMDAPAAVRGKELKALVRRTQTIVIPVLPSPMDTRAAAHFIAELLTVGRVSREKTRLAVVANRVREHTLAYQALERFLKSLGIPFVATLRDTQNYVRAAERGLGIFELAPSLVSHDLEQWQPLLKWLRSKRSLPKE